MKMSKWLSVLSALFCVFGFALFSNQIYAGTCEIKFTRTACPGKEEISYKKCDGKQSCSEFVESASVDECRAEAVKACENKRLEITKSKVINATFDDKAITSAGGKADFCEDYANRAAEFNRCSK